MRLRPRGLLGAAWTSPRLLLIATVLFWSGNFIVGRAVHGLVPPVALAFWRWTIAWLLVAAVGLRQARADLPALLRHWPILLGLSAFGVAGFNTFIYIGLTSTTAINALLLQSAMPLIILAATFALFDERPRSNQVAGIAVSLVGVAEIAARGDARNLATLSFNVGDIWILAAVVSYALYSALLRRRPKVSPLGFLAFTFGAGALMLLPLAIAEYRSGTRIVAAPQALLAIGYVAMFPGFLCYLFYNRAVELIGANAAGHYMHLMPVFGSVLAIVLLGERLGTHHVIGFVAIALGLLIAAVGRS
jgi:drug/metabolite transporter (DMT)-like permease